MSTSTHTYSTGRRSGCGCGLMAMLVGIVFIVGSVPLLIWNEARSVSTYRTLVEGAAIVQTTRADTIDPALDGKLVHVVGLADTTETLQDPELDITATAIKLHRKVEMYQWDETKHEDSDDRVTYRYSKKWSETHISSGSFYESMSHQNPDSMPYSSQTWTAAAVTLGARTLSASLVEQIDNYETLPVDQVPTRVDRKGQLYQDGVYLGNDPAAPAIGDLRINYTLVRPTFVSVIAQATSDTFKPYRGKAGDTIDLLETGERSAADMFAKAQADNVGVTWMLRLAGMGMMLAGFQALNQPLSRLLRLIPLVGGTAQRGFGCLVAVVAAIIALPLSGGIIGLSYIFFHLF